MNPRKGSLFVGSALSLALLSTQAQAHWCDDLWNSSYNIVVRPDSDTSPKNVYVQNNMGYLLPNFKLTASGGVTLTAPTTLKVAGTLLPGEHGTWKISGSSPAKIEDVTFSVSFGDNGESKCYPSKGASAVMIVKTDGTLYPAPPALAGLDSPANPGNNCTGEMIQGQSLREEAIADFEDENAGLDKLTQDYCAGRGSYDSRTGKVGTQDYCPSPTTAPTCPPASARSLASGNGTKYDYVHLWAAGELAARKSALGSRLVAVRAGLQCGAADPDTGFSGYALFMLGYLGDDAATKTFVQTKVTAGGELGTIGKAALYLMGDTTQKADVQAGAKSGSSTFAKAACAAALGIVDQDDATVTSVLIPLVKWIEPDTNDDGNAMFASHLLSLVAWDRRVWAPKGGDTGAVSFYGDTATSTGGKSGGAGGAIGVGGASGSGGGAGSSGSSGNKDAGLGSDADTSTGAASGSGGASGKAGASGAGAAAGTGGKPGAGTGGVAGSSGAPANGGVFGESGGASGPGGAVGSGGSQASAGSGGSGTNSGGATGSGSSGDTGSGGASAGKSSGCNLSGHSPATPMFYALAMVLGLAWIVGRQRKR